MKGINECIYVKIYLFMYLSILFYFQTKILFIDLNNIKSYKLQFG